jgi:hypothetical protein
MFRPSDNSPVRRIGALFSMNRGYPLPPPLIRDFLRMNWAHCGRFLVRSFSSETALFESARACRFDIGQSQEELCRAKEMHPDQE